MNRSTIDFIDFSYTTLILIGMYLIIMKWIAYRLHKKTETTDEYYYLAERKVGTLSLTSTIYATAINGLAFTGTPAQVYEGGILYLQLYALPLITNSCIYYFGPHIWNYAKRTGSLTPIELIESYYNNRSLTFFAGIIFLCSSLPFLLIQFVAVGKIFSTSTNLSYELGIVLVALTTALYLMWGGIRAVIVTDILQGTLTFGFLILTALLFWWWSEGLLNSVEILTKIIPQKLILTSDKAVQISERALTWSLSFFLFPHTIQRMMMAESAEVIKKSALCNGLIMLTGVTMALIIGVTATALLYGSLTDFDTLVVSLYQKFLPYGVPFLALSIFAASMSTIDSVTISLSSMIKRDIVNRFFTQKKLLGSLPVNTLVVGGIILGISLISLTTWGRGSVASLMTFGSSLTLILLLPVVGITFNCMNQSKVIMVLMICGLGTLIFSPLWYFLLVLLSLLITAYRRFIFSRRTNY